MEDSRLNITLTPNSFTNIYTALGVAVGTKLAIQNQSPAAITICIAVTPAVNKGFVLEPFGYCIIPAGSSGCHLKASSSIGATVSVQLGGWSVMNAPIDERVYNGLKALTTQPFVESNVKNGTQWEVSFENNSLASLAYSDAVMTTGNQYVLIKNRQITFTGSEIEVSVYKNPNFTGGSILPIYNLNTAIGGSPLAVLRAGVTVSSPGTEIAAKNHAYGTDTNVQQAVGTYSVNGLERVLMPNTSYLLRIQNQSATSIKLAGYITFYEGEISSLN